MCSANRDPVKERSKSAYLAFSLNFGLFEGHPLEVPYCFAVKFHTGWDFPAAPPLRNLTPRRNPPDCPSRGLFNSAARIPQHWPAPKEHHPFSAGMT